MTHRINDGNVQRLFEAADPGPFLKAKLTSVSGKGTLRVTYDWLYSALNCSQDGSSFYWIFEKRSDGSIVISPDSTPGHVPGTLYASVRDDWNWHVQTQAPHSADWITGVGRDERLTIEGTGLLTFALRGFNGKYVVVNHAADHHGGHVGYRLRSVGDHLSDASRFRVHDTTVLQDDLEFLEGYTVTEDDVRDVVAAYGFEMGDDAVTKLTDEFPEITPDRLRNHQPARQSRAVNDGTAETVGMVVGGLVGGAVGFAIGGPYGAAYGAALGTVVGDQIGIGVELHQPHEDGKQVVDPDVSPVAKTLVDSSPVGGPYDNKHVWEDLFQFAKFRQIGSKAMPDAGCLMTPDEHGIARVWYPSSRMVNKPIADRQKYSHSDIGYMSLFVIVKLDSGKYQLRLHPDDPLVNGPNRPNHSQLTRGSRILALIGGEYEPGDSEKKMQVYAAGELYYSEDGKLNAVYPRTGHYYNWSPGFDDDVLETTKRHLDALGYDTSEISFHHYWK